MRATEQTGTSDTSVRVAFEPLALSSAFDGAL